MTIDQTRFYIDNVGGILAALQASMHSAIRGHCVMILRVFTGEERPTAGDMGKRVALFMAVLVSLGLAAVGVSWWYFDWGHEPHERLPWLHGQPITMVFKELGQPDRQLEYAMKDSPNGEFRIELYNTYPQNDPVSQQARILELQWHRPRYDIAVWLHQVNGEWLVLDTCRWQARVAF